MLSISPINLLNVANLQNNKLTKVKYQTFPQYNKTLNSDCVTFSGKKHKSQKEITAIVTDASKRLEGRYNFSDNDINKIVSKVTPKNEEFLSEILKLGNNKLPAGNVIQLLDYINDKDTNNDEVREKIDNFNNLKNIVQGFGFKPSILSEHLDEMPPKSIVDILKSDLLLANIKHDFNSFPAAYNYAVKYYNHQLTKLKQPVTDYDKNNKASEVMKNDFSNLLLLGMVFDESVCNELMYNRGKYVNPIYMPRLRMLNGDDLDILRKVQTVAITYKENKGGDLSAYEVSLDDKISTLNLLAANREIINSGDEGIDFNKYIKPMNIYNKDANVKINFQDVKTDLMEKVLKHIGISSDKVDAYMQDYKRVYNTESEMIKNRDKFWDINYVHLLNAPEHSRLKDIVVSATNGDFEKFIFEEGTIAEGNKLNQQDFEKAGIDYQKWLHPDIKPHSMKFRNKLGNKEKIFTVKNWNRCPQESLFDGNYTTCCTGIDKDQGESFLHFMTNTCTTTLEVRTEKNKVIAMSRILMAKINGKLSMVVENIEVNNKVARNYLYDDKTKYKFREMIFDYARQFAKDINKTDEDIPVYFCSYYYKVKDIQKGLEPGIKYNDVDLIGVFPNDIYINSYGRRYDRIKAMFADDGDEFSLYLSNISQKAKPDFAINSDNDSDSDYNYADVSHYGH